METVKCLLTSDTHYGASDKTHRHHKKFLEQIKGEIENGVEIIVHAGDWCCNRQDQFRRTMAMFRKELGDIPIIAVRGNHDFWSIRRGSNNHVQKWMYSELLRVHAEWFKEYNIHHLDVPFEYKDIVFAGFDGWYNSINPDTNDSIQIPGMIESCPSMVYFSNKAYKDLDKILQLDLSKYRKRVCVTHFPPFWDKNDWKGSGFSANPRYFEPLKNKFDILCVGHSHSYINRNDNNILLLNCGSHYDQPKYVVFEV